MTYDTKALMPRYSPKPRSDYRGGGMASYGPATSTMLDTDEIWNLAYLSHDYDKRLEHPDPQFTVLCRQTAQFRLDGAGLDLINFCPPHVVLAGWLKLPAPRFVHLVERFKFLKQLPLYRAYGETWLAMIRQRERLCEFETVSYGQPTGMSVALARQLMIDLRSRK